MDHRDQWTAANFGNHPALAAGAGPIAGARASIVEREDENGDLVLDIGGPSGAAAAHHAANGHHAQRAEHHHAAHQEPHAAKPAHPAKGPVPRPADADFKPVHGKVPGPKNHVLCSLHGYVVDTDTHQVIANSVEDYKAAGLAHAKHDHAGHGAGNAGPDAHHAGHGGDGAAHGGSGGKPDRAANTSREANREHVMQALAFGDSLVRANMKDFQSSVEHSCNAFASYAEPKLQGLKGSVKSREAMIGIAHLAALGLNQVLGGMGQDSAGLALIRKMASQIQKSIEGAGAAANAAGDNEAGLLAGVRAVPAAASSGVIGLVNEAAMVFGEMARKVEDSLKSTGRNPADMDLLVEALISKNAAAASSSLERLGIPSPKTNAKAGDSMYFAMVRGFDDTASHLLK